MQVHHIDDILFTRDQIEQRVTELFTEMKPVLRGPHPVMIAILRGSFMFFADLVRHMASDAFRPQIDFTTMESYGSGTESSGRVRVAKEFTVSVQNADVLLVDDILDTGRTLSFAREHIVHRGARSVRTCVLLDKPSRRVVSVEADFVGFTVPDCFVVGYGLDYDNHYRELPYIAQVTFAEPRA